MPRIRKVNDNGPPPECPENTLPDPPGMDQALREIGEDYDLMKAHMAKRQGLNCDTTKAPWLVKKGMMILAFGLMLGCAATQPPRPVRCFSQVTVLANLNKYIVFNHCTGDYVVRTMPSLGDVREM